MIGRLSGVVLEKQPPYLLLDVQGVGYELSVPLSTCYRLPEVGASVILLVHLVVREDAHVLYGFLTHQERSLFRRLIKITGVGPKLALTILSGMEPDAFIQCIQRQDSQSLVNLPGVGRKTAERLLLDLRDQVDAVELTNSIAISNNHGVNEAVNALIALGYKPAEASRMVSRVSPEVTQCEEVIRLALQAVAV